MDVVVGNRTYIIEMDGEGNPIAKTFNEKYKTWVIMSFSTVTNDEAVQSMIASLKKDYLTKLLNS